MPAALEATADGFLKNGEPHLVISGAIHYFRVHPDLWRDRLRRLALMGCNAVETYVAWNLHEPREGEFVFEGIADLERFLEIAKEEGLDAIVRPGPYICAEWENGGFPGWLLDVPGVRLRHMNRPYIEKVDAFFDVLIPKIAAHQTTRGGNVIMVQVENEYGSFGDDSAYLEHLRDGLRERGIDELLVTSDGPARAWLSGGTVDGALATVNFGSRTEDVLDMAARELPDQPLMCMEFWNGWFDHFGEEHHTRDAESAAHELDVMLKNRMSVNFYMAHGGTNFGLTAGANHDGKHQPTIASYDYDSPIAENGALAEKFFAFRDVIAKYRDLPEFEEHARQLGIVAQPPHLGERDVRIATVGHLEARPGTTYPVPPSFEEVGLERGIMRLTREVEFEGSPWADGALAPLRLHGLHGRAWVFVGDHYVGAYWGDGEPRDPIVVELAHLTTVLLDGEKRRTLPVTIWIEGLGRVNFGPELGERKGILKGVWHQIRYLNDWDVEILELETAEAALLERRTNGEDLPAIIEAGFTVDASETGAHAFLDVSDAGYGIAYVNGFAVGRYWNRGPQKALFVPESVLVEGENRVTLLEFEKIPQSLGLAAGAY